MATNYPHRGKMFAVGRHFYVCGGTKVYYRKPCLFLISLDNFSFYKLL